MSSCSKVFLFFILVIICRVGADWEPDPTHGFGTQYNWVYTYKEALEKSKQSRLPILAINHELWCSECQKLSEKVKDSSRLGEYVNKFVFLNCAGTCGMEDKEFDLDGSYVPRVLFISTSGRLMKEIYNEQGDKKYKYYYTEISEIIKSVKKCLDYQKQKRRRK